MIQANHGRHVCLDFECACGRVLRLPLVGSDIDEREARAVEVVREVREEGWIVGRTGDLCPYCKPEGM